jgi:S-DNA-T family DNA segregation ATPase FtsK/SpoIIIE
MPSLNRGFDADDLLPEDLGAAVRRRLREFAGLALIGLTALGALALATWSVGDPSFSHATGTSPKNLLGTGGAAAADLLMQLYGVACVAVLLPVAVWGWRMFTNRRLDRLKLRLGLWVGGAFIAAAFAACLSRSTAWPLPTGLGGVIGDTLLRGPAYLAGGTLSGLPRMVIAIVLGVAAFAAVGVACGIGFSAPDEEEEAEEEESDKSEEDADKEEAGRGSVSIGFLVHAFLSAKARLRLALARLLAARTEAPRANLERHEPRFAADAPSLQASEPEEAAQGDEAEDEEEEAPRPKARKAKPVRPTPRKLSGYDLPALTLLAAPKATERFAPSNQVLEENANQLENVLEDFGVRGDIINAHPGPVVTLYELEPAPGIKSSRVIGLADDIARSMSAVSARVAVVPGRNVIGIELPNPTREKVYLRELLAAHEYTAMTAKLGLCLGKTIGGDPVIVDLARMPHLLIAGTTGSGKSVAINTMILSLVYKHRPDQCRLIMVDPKMLELSVYDGIPHLLTPVVTDPKKAVVALKWAVREMEDRYKKMSKLGVRNIDGYNARLADAKAKGETLSRTVHTGYDKDSGEAIYETEEFELEPLPYLVVVVDEMADLMMVAGKDIEGAIQRLAQMARAAGIHVILATQRPSVDVITGTIKANFPTRISFQVTSKIDSRTILGEQGAEQLLGQGDMLYMAGGGRISRVHGPFVSDDEVEKVVRHLKTQGAPQYLEEVTADQEEGEDGAVFDATGMGKEGDANDLYNQAVQVVVRDRKASTSYIQRRLQIGYNRAASLMERMEDEGIVGQPNHAGKREILVGEEAEKPF